MAGRLFTMSRQPPLNPLRVAEHHPQQVEVINFTYNHYPPPAGLAIHILGALHNNGEIIRLN